MRRNCANAPAFGLEDVEVAVGAFFFGTLGGFVLAGCAAVYAKQALIADAQANTDGHF